MRVHRRAVRRSAVLGVLALTLAGLWAAPAASARPEGPGGRPGWFSGPGGGRDDRPTAAVSLGDSFISGEAGRWLGNSAVATGTVDQIASRQGTDRAYRPAANGTGPGTSDPALVYGASQVNGCDRSDVSELHSARLPYAATVDLACAGAVTANVLRASAGGVGYKGEAPQDDQLATVARQYRVRLVVISIGGNDLGFSGIESACVAAYFFGGTPCAQSQQAAAAARLPQVTAGVTAVLDDVRATLAAAGYGPHDYRLVLQTYPQVLAAADNWRYPGAERSAVGGCPITDGDAAWTRNWVLPNLDGALAAAARSRGVQLLDLSSALAGHELCAASARQAVGVPDPRTAEWVRWIDLAGQGNSRESLHPNAYGQQAFGRCLRLALWFRGDVACTAHPARVPQAVRIRPLRPVHVG